MIRKCVSAFRPYQYEPEFHVPEGDTIYRTAEVLRKALVGREVNRFETSVEAVAAVDARTPVACRTVTAVEARGKHLLITLRFNDQYPMTNVQSGSLAGEGGESASQGSTPNAQAPTPNAQGPALVLHTHLRMTGAWHVYRPGEAWQKPVRYAKVVLYTAEFVTPCFSAPVVELLTEWQARRHPGLVTLGPDAITQEFDAEEALRRMRRRAEVEIGVALLDQRAMAGVGNVYKSEVLFLQKISPFLKVGEIADETLDALIAESHRLLRLNRAGGSHRTHFGLNDRERLWVYGRSGEPCRVCGEPIRMRRQGIDARSTYYCPRCQHVGVGR